MSATKNIKFIIGSPVAFLQDKKALVVADLHLGIEHEFYNSGIFIEPQAQKFAKIIKNLVEDLGAKFLVIVGDLKHEVPGISLRELKEIPKFFSILDNVEILVAKGNHDTNLEDVAPSNVKIYSSRGFKLGKYGFFHGHAWTSRRLISCDYLFMSHIHPVVEFKDKFSYKTVERVWVKGMLDRDLTKKRYKVKKPGKMELIIVPAFNRLVGGMPINSTDKNQLIGPIISNNFLDIDCCRAYLLDGTSLGQVKTLRELFR